MLLHHPWIQSHKNAWVRNEGKRHAAGTTNNKAMLVQGGGTALLPNCQGFVGKAYVSIHSRRCPLHRYRSVGHRPFVHGTSAQYKLATSTYLNVVRHVLQPKTPLPTQFPNEIFFEINVRMIVAHVWLYSPGMRSRQTMI